MNGGSQHLKNYETGVFLVMSDKGAMTYILFTKCIRGWGGGGGGGGANDNEISFFQQNVLNVFFFTKD